MTSINNSHQYDDIVTMQHCNQANSIYTNNPFFSNNNNNRPLSTNMYPYPFSPQLSSSSSSSSSRSLHCQPQAQIINFSTNSLYNDGNVYQQSCFNFLPLPSMPPPPPPPPPVYPPSIPTRPISLHPLQMAPPSHSSGYEFRRPINYSSNLSMASFDEDISNKYSSNIMMEAPYSFNTTPVSHRMCKSHVIIHVVHSKRVVKPVLQVSVVPMEEDSYFENPHNNHQHYQQHYNACPHSSPQNNYFNIYPSGNYQQTGLYQPRPASKLTLSDTPKQRTLHESNTHLTSSPIRVHQQASLQPPPPPPPPPPPLRPMSPPNMPPLILRHQQHPYEPYYSPRLDALDTSNLNTSTFLNTTLINSSAVCSNNSRITTNNNGMIKEFLMSPHLKTLYDLKKIENANLPPPPPYQPPPASIKDSSSPSTITIRKCSFNDFKSYIEQHYVENVFKDLKEREKRRLQIEEEMVKLGDLDDEEKRALRLLYFKRETNYLRLKRTKMNKNMFKILKILGLGAFGEVYLVSKKEAKTDEESQLYAMKVLSKSDIFKRNHAAHIKAERDILVEAANTDWVVKLYYTFQDDESLYFIMDYVPGGDLMYLLIKRGVFDECMARFYIGEMTCAIECVHKLGFIHRDIKPDNILIDKDGHIKLTDFGLSTRFDRQRYYHNSSTHVSHTGEERNGNTFSKERKMAYSLVGSPNYIAPEILLRKGYTKSCDWWSLGVIMYEMLIGHAPFFDERAEVTQRMIENWEKTFRIPDQCKLSQEASDLINKLCTNAEIRLDANKIKVHSFFNNSFDFNPTTVRINNKPPFVPAINSLDDTSNFEPISEQAFAEHKHKINKIFATHTNNNYASLPTVNQPRLYEFTFRRFDDNYFLSTASAFAPVSVSSISNKIPLDANSDESSMSSSSLSNNDDIDTNGQREEKGFQCNNKIISNSPQQLVSLMTSLSTTNIEASNNNGAAVFV